MADSPLLVFPEVDPKPIAGNDSETPVLIRSLFKLIQIT